MTCSHRAMFCGVTASSGRFIAVSRLDQRARGQANTKASAACVSEQ
jgi:hypothetical protein